MNAGLKLQWRLSRIFTPVLYYGVLGWMKIFKRYQFRALRETRKAYSEIIRNNPGPLLICANHLTLIDSFLIIWAFSSGWRCWLQSSRFPWNLPEKRNFYHNLWLRTLCYFGKCIPVVRQGPREKTKRVLDKVNFLLNRGESIMVFPEGGRSRTGSVDVANFSYGIGTMLQECPQAKVLCVYLRGQAQEKYSDFPKTGEEFYLDFRLIQPSSQNSGLRGARDLATQVIHQLVEMEKVYFGNWQRHY